MEKQTNGVEKRMYYLHFRRGDMPHLAGPRGKYQGGQEAEDRSWGKAEAKAFFGVFMGKAR